MRQRREQAEGYHVLVTLVTMTGVLISSQTCNIILVIVFTHVDVVFDLTEERESTLNSQRSYTIAIIAVSERSEVVTLVDSKRI